MPGKRPPLPCARPPQTRGPNRGPLFRVIRGSEPRTPPSHVSFEQEEQADQEERQRDESDVKLGREFPEEQAEPDCEEREPPDEGRPRGPPTGHGGGNPA